MLKKLQKNRLVFGKGCFLSTKPEVRSTEKEPSVYAERIDNKMRKRANKWKPTKAACMHGPVEESQIVYSADKSYPTYIVAIKTFGQISFISFHLGPVVRRSTHSFNSKYCTSNIFWIQFRHSLSDKLSAFVQPALHEWWLLNIIVEAMQ